MKAIEEFSNIKSVLILGAGGTAKAIAVALSEAKIETTVLNRSKNKLEFFLKSNLHFNSIKIKFSFQKTIFAGFFFFKSVYLDRAKLLSYYSIKNINSIKLKYITKVYGSLQKFKISVEKYGVLDKKLKPASISYLIFIHSKSIVIWFDFLFFGLLKYYKNCNNYKRLVIYIFYLLKWSLLYTLSKKHKKDLKIIFQKYLKSGLFFKNKKELTILQVNFLYNTKKIKKLFFIEYLYKNL
jgi:hypothetical protein